jgi:hypothetical protein
MDNILSKEAVMPRPPHQRFHITQGKKRTTISLDNVLAALLAARLGETPGTRPAAARVRAWLQAQAAEGPGGPKLNRRLFQRALLEVSDKELSKRCAVWLGETEDRAGATAPPRKLAGERRSTAAPATAVVPGQFVLYRAAPGLAPDVLVRGGSVEDVRARAAETYAEDDARPAILGASLITTEKERGGRHYIRRCSEDVWAALTARRNILPVTDPDGIWRTRREAARMRKATAWRDALRTMAKPRRKTG